MVSASLQELDLLWEKSLAAEGDSLAENRRLAEEALSKADGIQRLHALIVLAVCDFNESAFQRAFETLLDIISRYGKTEDKWLVRAYHYLGMSYHQFNLYAEASQMHHKQFELAEKLKDVQMMAAALRRVGADHDHMGQAQIALGYYERSLALYSSINEVYGTAAVHYNMSLAHSILGNHEAALASIERALPNYKKAGVPKGLARIHGHAAVTLTHLGQHERALEHLEHSLSYAKKSKMDESLTLAYIRQGIVFRLLGRIEESLDVLQKALKLSEASEDIHFGLDIHQELSKLYKLKGDFEQAFYHQEQFHSLYEQQMEKAMNSRFESLSIVHRTEQAQAEAQRLRELREQDRIYFEKLNQVKDELVSNASHDLKNPLSNIMAVLHLIKRHGRLDDERGADLLARIENSAKQMRELITNLLDLARLETGKSLILEESELVAFAHEIVKEYQLIAENQGIKLEFISKPEKQKICYDTLLLRRVFANLLSNALKFTAKGGKVILSIEKEEKMLLISIVDNGIGIPVNDLPFIFDRFYRVPKESHRKIEGTGLGLPICKAIVEQHGGKIGVESTEGQGSKFWFRLPLE